MSHGKEFKLPAFRREHWTIFTILVAMMAFLLGYFAGQYFEHNRIVNEHPNLQGMPY
jgi:hypothetical protein